VIAAVTAIAAVLILARLAHRSLEQDETFSAVLVGTPAHVFWHVVTTREANQSAFYVLLRVWSHLGITEGWERLPSALAAIASVPVVWLVGRRVVPGVAAVIAPSLLVANGFFLRVAQFGRGYAFVVLITAAASLALLIAVQDGRRWAWWVWAVLLAAAAYFHTFALLVVGAHLLALALLPERPTKREVALPLALYAALVAPLVLFIATRSSDQVFWIPRTTPTGVENLGVSLVGDAGRAALAVAVVAALIAAVSLLRRERTDGWAGWFLVLWLVVPLAVGIGLSLVKPLLVDVYFSIALPPLALMLAAGSPRSGLARSASCFSSDCSGSAPARPTESSPPAPTRTGAGPTPSSSTTWRRVTHSQSRSRTNERELSTTSTGPAPRSPGRRRATRRTPGVTRSRSAVVARPAPRRRSSYAPRAPRTCG
jgi:mannosyltransferase